MERVVAGHLGVEARREHPPLLDRHGARGPRDLHGSEDVHIGLPLLDPRCADEDRVHGPAGDALDVEVDDGVEAAVTQDGGELTGREVQVLLAHLPRYVQHLQRHPHSLLARLLDDAWFALPPPKSTGREQFHLDWVDARIGDAPLAPAEPWASMPNTGVW
mgnify:CR=1 FL=1